MGAEIYWVRCDTPGRLAIMPRPRGGEWLEDDLQSLRSEGVDVVVSLLQPEEVAELDLIREEALCRAVGMEYLSHPVRDHDVPSAPDPADLLVRELGQRLRRRRNVAIHCRAGIGRSATLAACALAQCGLPLHEALLRLAEARGFAVPETPEQLQYVEDFCRRCRP